MTYILSLLLLTQLRFTSCMQGIYLPLSSLANMAVFNRDRLAPESFEFGQQQFDIPFHKLQVKAGSGDPGITVAPAAQTGLFADVGCMNPHTYVVACMQAPTGLVEAQALSCLRVCGLPVCMSALLTTNTHTASPGWVDPVDCMTVHVHVSSCLCVRKHTCEHTHMHTHTHTHKQCVHPLTTQGLCTCCRSSGGHRQSWPSCL